ncbi:MAG: hypothetical protein O3C21_01725 [Verrucomicrobia bacterium]|nr:hypothetical protein [Verrucomicrobiota bacterium]
MVSSLLTTNGTNNHEWGAAAPQAAGGWLADAAMMFWTCLSMPPIQSDACVVGDGKVLSLIQRIADSRPDGMVREWPDSVQSVQLKNGDGRG